MRRRRRRRRNRERPYLEPPTKNKIFFPTRTFSTSLSFFLSSFLSPVSPLATRPSSSISTHKNATTVTTSPTYSLMDGTRAYTKIDDSHSRKSLRDEEKKRRGEFFFFFLPIEGGRKKIFVRIFYIIFLFDSIGKVSLRATPVNENIEYMSADINKSRESKRESDLRNEYCKLYADMRRTKRATNQRVNSTI